MDTVNRFAEKSDMSLLSSFEMLYGNDSAKEYFISALSKGTLSHAYILEGGPGSGRHTLCRALACALAPDFSEKILGINEPDIINVCHDDKHKTIGIDIIREMKSDTAVSPNELDFLMFIIEDADSMTFQAQNALLKLLEEPPADVYIILLCESIAGLLPTVISRAPVIRMQQFSEEELSDYLIKNDKKVAQLYSADREAFDFALRTSGGRIGEALRRLNGKGKSAGESSTVGKIDKILSHLSNGKKADFFTEMNDLPTKREEVDLLLTMLEEAVRDLLYVKALPDSDGSPEMLYYRSREDARLLSDEFTNSALIHISVCITETHEKLDMNANVRLLCTVLSEQLWSAAKQ